MDDDREESLVRLREALSEARPLYVLPKEPVANEVLLPALACSSSLDVMMGYFSSSSFSEVAPGLATYLRRTSSPMRLVVSPFLTNEDYMSLVDHKGDLAAIALEMFVDAIPSESDLSRHTLECLAWMIAKGRLEIKIAVMRSSIFHPKVWLFNDKSAAVALHGSTNFTRRGLTMNREQLTLSRDWYSGESKYHVDRLREEFDELWSGGDEDTQVLELPDAISRKIVSRFKSSEQPNENDCSDLWNRACGAPASSEQEEIGPGELVVPDYVDFRNGEYRHQGEAIDSWEASDCRGILEMATGSGKTITALICAARLQNRLRRLMVVIVAPYRPLIEQWRGEVEKFGINPINLSSLGGREARGRELRRADRRLRLESSKSEVLLVSNDTFCSDEFRDEINRVRPPIMLISDECHGLGSSRFIKEDGYDIDYRLGLSATPVRQYDEEGTDSLVRFMGKICYSYDLESAIGKCLTQYRYYPHLVELNPSEMENWRDLTERIAQNSWRRESDDTSYLDKLYRDRRLILETAERKLDALAGLLSEIDRDSLRYALIYATDKYPEQLIRVNNLLSRMGIMFHQLTSEETGSRTLTGSILSAFQSGDLRVLTAKRVLDEGVNIPQIQLAYILASTTVRRQWIQRRGRLLRTCEATGKKNAIIHDFVVVPPTIQVGGHSLDHDARQLVRGELERVWEFARLSSNAADDDGPYGVVEYLQSLANEEV